MWGECGRRATRDTVMAGHSPLKTGVNALVSRPSTTSYSEGRQDLDARHKAGHDEELRPLQRSQTSHRPLALMDAAGVAPQPGFRTVPYVAREEVTALEAVRSIGIRDRRNGSTSASVRVLPRLASILVRPAEQFGDRRLGIGEVQIGWLAWSGDRTDRSCLLGRVRILPRERVELVGEAAPGCGGSERQRERDGLGTQAP